MVVGARLLSLSDVWESFTDDQWVLKAIRVGLDLEFTSEPFHYQLPKKIVMSLEMKDICSEEVSGLLEKKAIEEIPSHSSCFISSLICIRKRLGGFRPIINLKPMNNFIKYRHFRMESLKGLYH